MKLEDSDIRAIAEEVAKILAAKQQPNPDHDRMLTAAEVAALIGRAVGTLYVGRSKNKKHPGSVDIPPATTLVGKTPLWRLGDVLSWLQDRRGLA